MSLKVLVISHMYPNPANPMSGIFVHNQVKALKQAGVECRVLSPIPRFPLYPKWRMYRRFPAQTVMDGIPIHYVPTWMFPGGMFFLHTAGCITCPCRRFCLRFGKSFPLT